MNCIPEYLPPEASTRRIKIETMHEVVYGRPRPRQRPLVSSKVTFRAALVGAVAGLLGCGHFIAPRAAAEAPDTIGTLTPSETHVAQAPVHATTDFGHVEIVSTDDDDAAVPMAQPVAVERDAAPEIAPKTDGVTMGGAR
jgi:hypothetical protein